MLMLMAQPLQAKVENNLVNDNQLCLNATQKFEKKYQIKKHLLTTISNVETGRFSAESQKTIAWPWTINAQGKGQFFATKNEAVAEVKRLQAQGVKSIDVGCMQINLSYHGDAFENIEEAFNPEKNVEYAAQFLTSLYENRGKSWDNAAMAYHSSEATKARRYKAKIDTHLELVQKNIPSKTNAIIVSSAKTPSVNINAKKQTIDAKAWREAKLEEYRKNKTRAN